MECYLTYLETCCRTNKEPTCPLDRSILTIEDKVRLLVENQVRMDKLFKSWQVFETSTNSLFGTWTREQTPRRVRVQRIRRQDAVHERSPTGVQNVREEMEPEITQSTIYDIGDSFEPLSLRFPTFADIESFLEGNEENIPPAGSTPPRSTRPRTTFL